jgi:hypothetical protein
MPQAACFRSSDKAVTISSEHRNEPEAKINPTDAHGDLSLLVDNQARAVPT